MPPREESSGWGEGRPQAPRQPASAPHPGPLPASGERGRDPDGPIWRGDAFHTDTWTAATENEPLTDGPVILSKARWLAERDQLAVRDGALGLRLEPGEGIDDIAGDLGRFALIALAFPKFSDGRAFSTARLLKEKYGFAGELRAVGNVLADQIPFMRRVGFDSYEVSHAPTRRALAQGRIVEVTLAYQPGDRRRQGAAR